MRTALLLAIGLVEVELVDLTHQVGAETVVRFFLYEPEILSPGLGRPQFVIRSIQGGQ